MRRSIAAAGALMLGLVAFTPVGASAAGGKAGPGLSPAEQARLASGEQLAPKAAPGAKPAGPNPYLSLLPDARTADYAGWTAYMKQQSKARAAARLKALGLTADQAKAADTPPVVVDEDEIDGTRGANDNPALAQRIPDFGTGDKKTFAKMRILGSLDPEPVSPTTQPATPEDDGAIPLAGSTSIGSLRSGVTVSAEIGDGPHGSAGTDTGDFDFYELTAAAGKVITVQTSTPTGDLDTYVRLYDADGTIVAFNDDADGLDSKLQYSVPADGTYYAMVASYASLPSDPFDPASGPGANTEGPYTVTITSAADDTDFYAIRLRPGDVLGARVTGSAGYLTVYDTQPREVHGSSQDASFIYPMDSPLPGGGNAVTDYVATKAGWHYVGVANGDGAYDITVEAYRPGLQGQRPVQTLYLDFDGARVNTYVVGGGNGNVDLSPLAAFLGNWGLTRADENALIDKVVAEVTENLQQDMIESGLNQRFALKVRNSKDNPDVWGQENVSRVVVGGTIEESGINTIGIAQSIDPGNFGTEETALVLLDVLSSPPGGVASLNTYMTPASDRLAFVGQALGNVISHEAGHFFGNFHTDNADATANLMDAGGTGFGTLFGVGPDGIGGTADDADVDFGEDQFIPSEGFSGTENTLGRVAFGLTS
ncbi:PPC domain-containing protein [Mangrovihabitans endophyticus]|uniref:Peptidase C-terminal archaeal/bacterial domain-containing protein n=1 Tax=Mangrovihabitans endophyticus TaxID=1751298 RepID=A0A8J3FNB3_9ACTN|nr:PPC domain-containing protein [Mangrovihabitans endophyticus]GGK91239.1 hypothetical protein GCM10012284_26360 [Mangrovihabitans endophyticus]